MNRNRIPTPLRLDPHTVKLIEKAEANGRGKNRTEVIERAVELVLALSDKAIALLESAAERTGKTETRLLEECILAQLGKAKLQ